MRHTLFGNGFAIPQTAILFAVACVFCWCVAPQAAFGYGQGYYQGGYYSQGYYQAYYQASYTVLSSLITSVPYSPGAGGYAPASYIYWGGGGGGGLILNHSTVNGGDGGGSPDNGGKGYGGGGGGNYYSGVGGDGAPGVVYVEWDAPPFSCSVSVTPDSVTYGGAATLSYSSTNAASFYINNAGYMTPNTSGSFSVPSNATTDYTGLVGNGVSTSTCPASLTVNAPAAPTATISASSTPIYAGQSTGIHATFAAGSGDALSADNIDSPEGSGLGATTNPDANKYITFTPPSAGTYTFFARAQTGYFNNWTSYASTTVTVLPTCTAAYSCSGQDIIHTDTFCNTSTVISCTAPSFCSAGSSVCLDSTPAFNIGSSGLTGHLQAIPSLLPQGLTAKLFWDISNVSSCSVTGTDGDHWTGPSSGSGGKVSVPIFQQTTYTLSCTGLDTSTVSESVTVNVLPVFQER